jgi:7-keto-8-aminopelargonate synthetase-like enzyme
VKKIHFDQSQQIIEQAIENKMAHVTMDDVCFHGNNIQIRDESLRGFIFCDYLGLSTDKRLIEASQEATARYGVFTSVSRSYLKLGLYEEVEHLMEQIFGQPVILISRTSLGHVAALPVITSREDAVLLDHYVHTSVRNAADMLKGYGNHVETIRHNNINLLEQRIRDLRSKYKRIWYLVDGVYSMHGDTLPTEPLNDLLDRYPSFHLYVDDAHGMSWTGKYGRGFTLERMGYHPKMFLISSLAKGFGTGGSVLVCRDQPIKKKILAAGAPLIFSGPLSPPTLGAIKASAMIHLSGEIQRKQNRLHMLTDHFMEVAGKLQMPLIAQNNSPIFFVPTGKPEMTTRIAIRMKQHGFFVTGGVYPAVPYNASGIRPIISLHHDPEEIEQFLTALHAEVNRELRENDLSLEKLLKYYHR